MAKSDEAYYKKSAGQVYDSMKAINESSTVRVAGVGFLHCPNVFPSHLTRSSGHFIEVLSPFFPGAEVLDMGCGIGIVSVFALMSGAASALAVDINPEAVAKAKINIEKYGILANFSAVISDGFSEVPHAEFDLIAFNPPFHSESAEIDSALERSIRDPDFASMKSFLNDAENYLAVGGRIVIAFSDKCDVVGLECLFDQYGYRWELYKRFNEDQEFDSRFYLLQR